MDPRLSYLQTLIEALLRATRECLDEDLISRALELLQEARKMPSYNVDGGQGHAVRLVIKRLGELGVTSAIGVLTDLLLESRFDMEAATASGELVQKT